MLLANPFFIQKQCDIKFGTTTSPPRVVELSHIEEQYNALMDENYQLLMIGYRDDRGEGIPPYYVSSTLVASAVQICTFTDLLYLREV